MPRLKRHQRRKLLKEHYDKEMAEMRAFFKTQQAEVFSDVCKMLAEGAVKDQFRKEFPCKWADDVGKAPLAPDQVIVVEKS